MFFQVHCWARPVAQARARSRLIAFALLATFLGCGPSGTPGPVGTATADAALGDLQGCATAADCDDGDACTQDMCGAGGLCTSLAIAGCNQPCGSILQCAQGVCDPSKNICVGCVADGHCKAGWCDDGKCTIAKVCGSDLDCKAQGKVCSPESEVCVDCLTNADCAATARCESRHCVQKTACTSSKDCPKICDKKAGVCAECATSADCSPQAYCNPFGQCAPGVCTVGKCVSTRYFQCKADRSGFEPGTDCASSNPCSAGTCQPSGCSKTLTAGPCDDGDLCTSGDSCKNGACSGQVVGCTDKNPCTLDACVPATGCKYSPSKGTCDDGNPCSSGDSCQNGTCAGLPLACDDGEPCTTDSCSQASGCIQQASAKAPCNDGDACTSADSCIQGGCKGGQVNCDDGQPCTADACNAKSGCAHVPNTAQCDDGNLCTDGDTCQAGKCSATLKNCDDNVACTADTCSQGVGCLHKAQDNACDDKNACTDDTCDASKGCGHQAIVAMCADGNACTTADVCNGGKCDGGPPPKCDDGNPCTDDKCHSDLGCVALPNAATCDDGAACTGADACAKGKCAGQPRLFQANAPGSTYGHFLAAVGDGFAAAAASGPNQVKLARYSQYGAELWEKTYVVPGGFGTGGAVRLVATDWGFGIGYGTISGSLIATDLAGVKKWQVDITAGMGGSGSGGLIGLPDGLIWLGSGHSIRVNSSGAIVWDLQMASSNFIVNQATPWQQGFLTVGTIGSDTAFARNYGLDGLPLWTATYAGQPATVVATADGFVMAGHQRIESIDYPWLAKADTTGKLIWSRTLPLKYAGATALASAADGWVIAGWINGVTPGNGDDFLLLRTDLDGNPFWTRAYGTAKQDRAGAVLAFGGGFLLGGPELYRTDAFGNATCASSGNCVALNPGNCQDGNPCTGNDCAATKGGCNYPAWGDGLTCGVGKMCKAAVCGP